MALTMPRSSMAAHVVLQEWRESREAALGSLENLFEVRRTHARR